MTSTTHESTVPYQTALDWSVPSQYQPQLRADLNELQAFRAAKAEQDRRLDDGRRQTSKRLEALVLAAINNTRAKLVQAVATNRVNVIRQHLTLKADHYGLEQATDGTVKLPNRKLIKRLLKSQGL